tara:strand:- start:2102 stop:2989 length:888 start_codon:yes stop_codon:yes gene_type:complete
MRIAKSPNESKIEKIFVINLKDKINFFKKFNVINYIHQKMERLEAVDSRSNHRVYENYGLSLDPVGLCSKFYFSESFGAIGCYLSHYLIWKSMVDRGISSALILEDDVKISDVARLLKSEDYFVDLLQYDLIQFNTRTPDDFLNPYGTKCNAFNGTESYYLSLNGAKKLFSLTHNRDCFQGIIKDAPFGEHQVMGIKPSYTIYPQQYEMYKNEPPQDWTKNNAITCAVDKFIGYCADPELPPNKTLQVKVCPFVNLSKRGLSSDIEPDNNPFWNCNEEELINLKQSESFEWWNKV